MSEKWISKILGDPYRPLFTHPTKNNPRSLKFYGRNYSVIPIVMLAIADMCWLTFCSVQGFIRTNVVLTRWDRTQRDMIDLLIKPRNRKFLTFNQTFPVQQDLYDTYKKMEEAEQEECEEDSIPPRQEE
ncbi:uncharacterized protein LOC114332479 [Diabrotica virgifera virgifera]|uniref:Uncharacterized protein n=1 Tax=Diabrotica virgifera virgifera TaxID=50390 RepID=A0ABM5IPG4_DIAVI|nr:uncharacterized protein LOC114332479 [Diabrotica virgifera virgifera]